VILINLFGQIYHSIIDLTGIVFYLSMADFKVDCFPGSSLLSFIAVVVFVDFI